MALSKNAWLGGLVLLALACGGVLAYRLAAPSHPIAPDFTLDDLDGRARSLDEYAGRVRLVNFWASWCKPCRDEIPMLVAAQNRYADGGLQIIGVAVDTRRAASAFAERYHMNYPILADPAQGARIQDAYTGATAPAGVLPYTVLVGRGGRIRQRIAGALTRQRLERLIEPLLAQKDRPP